MRSHILIDLDGTISDSSVGIARSLQHAFSTCGYRPPTDDEVRAAIGPPFEITFPRMGIPERDIERVIVAYRDRYEDVGLFENEMYDGIEEMLTELGAEYTLALATAKPQHSAVRITEHFGLTDHFEYQAGAGVEVGSARRSKAQVIEHAFEQLGIDGGAHVVMLGDRDHDVEGALANEIDCIGVTWGFGSVDELRGAGAVATVDRPADVAAAVSATYRAERR
ncbi:MAG: HAD hydrolase-like protein [Actinomycetota bacterium]